MCAQTQTAKPIHLVIALEYLNIIINEIVSCMLDHSNFGESQRVMGEVFHSMNLSCFRVLETYLGDSHGSSMKVHAFACGNFDRKLYSLLNEVWQCVYRNKPVKQCIDDLRNKIINNAKWVVQLRRSKRIMLSDKLYFHHGRYYIHNEGNFIRVLKNFQKLSPDAEVEYESESPGISWIFTCMPFEMLETKVVSPVIEIKAPKSSYIDFFSWARQGGILPILFSMFKSSAADMNGGIITINVWKIVGWVVGSIIGLALVIYVLKLIIKGILGSCKKVVRIKRKSQIPKAYRQMVKSNKFFVDENVPEDKIYHAQAIDVGDYRVYGHGNVDSLVKMITLGVLIGFFAQCMIVKTRGEFVAMYQGQSYDIYTNGSMVHWEIDEIYEKLTFYDSYISGHEECNPELEEACAHVKDSHWCTPGRITMKGSGVYKAERAGFFECPLLIKCFRCTWNCKDVGDFTISHYDVAGVYVAGSRNGQKFSAIINNNFVYNGRIVSLNGGTSRRHVMVDNQGYIVDCPRTGQTDKMCARNVYYNGTWIRDSVIDKGFCYVNANNGPKNTDSLRIGGKIDILDVNKNAKIVLPNAYLTFWHPNEVEQTISGAYQGLEVRYLEFNCEYFNNTIGCDLWVYFNTTGHEYVRIIEDNKELITYEFYSSMLEKHGIVIQKETMSVTIETSIEVHNIFVNFIDGKLNHTYLPADIVSQVADEEKKWILYSLVAIISIVVICGIIFFTIMACVSYCKRSAFLRKGSTRQKKIIDVLVYDIANNAFYAKAKSDWLINLANKRSATVLIKELPDTEYNESLIMLYVSQAKHGVFVEAEEGSCTWASLYWNGKLNRTWKKSQLMWKDQEMGCSKFEYPMCLLDYVTSSGIMAAYGHVGLFIAFKEIGQRIEFHRTVNDSAKADWINVLRFIIKNENNFIKEVEYEMIRFLEDFCHVIRVFIRSMDREDRNKLKISSLEKEMEGSKIVRHIIGMNCFKPISNYKKMNKPIELVDKVKEKVKGVTKAIYHFVFQENTHVNYTKKTFKNDEAFCVREEYVDVFVSKTSDKTEVNYANKETLTTFIANYKKDKINDSTTAMIMTLYILIAYGTQAFKMMVEDITNAITMFSFNHDDQALEIFRSIYPAVTKDEWFWYMTEALKSTKNVQREGQYVYSHSYKISELDKEEKERMGIVSIINNSLSMNKMEKIHRKVENKVSRQYISHSAVMTKFWETKLPDSEEVNATGDRRMYVPCEGRPLYFGFDCKGQIFKGRYAKGYGVLSNIAMIKYVLNNYKFDDGPLEEAKGKTPPKIGEYIWNNIQDDYFGNASVLTVMEKTRKLVDKYIFNYGMKVDYVKQQVDSYRGSAFFQQQQGFAFPINKFTWEDNVEQTREVVARGNCIPGPDFAFHQEIPMTKDLQVGIPQGLVQFNIPQQIEQPYQGFGQVSFQAIQSGQLYFTQIFNPQVDGPCLMAAMAGNVQGQLNGQVSEGIEFIKKVGQHLAGANPQYCFVFAVLKENDYLVYKFGNEQGQKMLCILRFAHAHCIRYVLSQNQRVGKAIHIEDSMFVLDDALVRSDVPWMSDWYYLMTNQRIVEQMPQIPIQNPNAGFANVPWTEPIFQGLINMFQVNINVVDVVEVLTGMKIQDRIGLFDYMIYCSYTKSLPMQNVNQWTQVGLQVVQDGIRQQIANRTNILYRGVTMVTTNIRRVFTGSYVKSSKSYGSVGLDVWRCFPITNGDADMVLDSRIDKQEARWKVRFYDIKDQFMQGGPNVAPNFGFVMNAEYFILNRYNFQLRGINFFSDVAIKNGGIEFPEEPKGGHPTARIQTTKAKKFIMSKTDGITHMTYMHPHRTSKHSDIMFIYANWKRWIINESVVNLFPGMNNNNQFYYFGDCVYYYSQVIADLLHANRTAALIGVTFNYGPEDSIDNGNWTSTIHNGRVMIKEGGHTWSYDINPMFKFVHTSMYIESVINQVGNTAFYGLTNTSDERTFIPEGKFCDQDIDVIANSVLSLSNHDIRVVSAARAMEKGMSEGERSVNNAYWYLCHVTSCGWERQQYNDWIERRAIRVDCDVKAIKRCYGSQDMGFSEAKVMQVCSDAKATASYFFRVIYEWLVLSPQEDKLCKALDMIARYKNIPWELDVFRMKIDQLKTKLGFCRGISLLEVWDNFKNWIIKAAKRVARWIMTIPLTPANRVLAQAPGVPIPTWFEFMVKTTRAQRQSFETWIKAQNMFVENVYNSYVHMCVVRTDLKSYWDKQVGWSFTSTWFAVLLVEEEYGETYHMDEIFDRRTYTQMAVDALKENIPMLNFFTVVDEEVPRMTHEEISARLEAQINLEIPGKCVQLLSVTQGEFDAIEGTTGVLGTKNVTYKNNQLYLVGPSQGQFMYYCHYNIHDFAAVIDNAKAYDKELVEVAYHFRQNNGSFGSGRRCPGSMIITTIEQLAANFPDKPVFQGINKRILEKVYQRMSKFGKINLNFLEFTLKECMLSVMPNISQMDTGGLRCLAVNDGGVKRIIFGEIPPEMQDSISLGQQPGALWMWNKDLQRPVHLYGRLPGIYVVEKGTGNYGPHYISVEKFDISLYMKIIKQGVVYKFVNSYGQAVLKEVFVITETAYTKYTVNASDVLCTTKCLAPCPYPKSDGKMRKYISPSQNIQQTIFCGPGGKFDEELGWKDMQYENNYHFEKMVEEKVDKPWYSIFGFFKRKTLQLKSYIEDFNGDKIELQETEDVLITPTQYALEKKMVNNAFNDKTAERIAQQAQAAQQELQEQRNEEVIIEEDPEDVEAQREINEEEGNFEGEYLGNDPMEEQALLFEAQAYTLLPSKIKEKYKTTHYGQEMIKRIKMRYQEEEGDKIFEECWSVIKGQSYNKVMRKTFVVLVGPEYLATNWLFMAQLRRYGTKSFEFIGTFENLNGFTKNYSLQSESEAFESLECDKICYYAKYGCKKVGQKQYTIDVEQIAKDYHELEINFSANGECQRFYDQPLDMKLPTFYDGKPTEGVYTTMYPLKLQILQPSLKIYLDPQDQRKTIWNRIAQLLAKGEIDKQIPLQKYSEYVQGREAVRQWETWTFTATGDERINAACARYSAYAWILVAKSFVKQFSKTDVELLEKYQTEMLKRTKYGESLDYLDNAKVKYILAPFMWMCHNISSEVVVPYLSPYVYQYKTDFPIHWLYGPITPLNCLEDIEREYIVNKIGYNMKTKEDSEFYVGVILQQLNLFYHPSIAYPQCYSQKYEDNLITPWKNYILLIRLFERFTKGGDDVSGIIVKMKDKLGFTCEYDRPNQIVKYLKDHPPKVQYDWDFDIGRGKKYDRQETEINTRRYIGDDCIVFPVSVNSNTREILLFDFENAAQYHEADKEYVTEITGGGECTYFNHDIKEEMVYDLVTEFDVNQTEKGLKPKPQKTNDTPAVIFPQRKMESQVTEALANVKEQSPKSGKDEPKKVSMDKPKEKTPEEVLAHILGVMKEWNMPSITYAMYVCLVWAVKDGEWNNVERELEEYLFIDLIGRPRRYIFRYLRAYNDIGRVDCDFVQNNFVRDIGNDKYQPGEPGIMKSPTSIIFVFDREFIKRWRKLEEKMKEYDSEWRAYTVDDLKRPNVQFLAEIFYMNEKDEEEYEQWKNDLEAGKVKNEKLRVAIEQDNPMIGDFIMKPESDLAPQKNAEINDTEENLDTSSDSVVFDANPEEVFGQNSSESDDQVQEITTLASTQDKLLLDFLSCTKLEFESENYVCETKLVPYEEKVHISTTPVCVYNSYDSCLIFANSKMIDIEDCPTRVVGEKVCSIPPLKIDNVEIIPIITHDLVFYARISSVLYRFYVMKGKWYIAAKDIVIVSAPVLEIAKELIKHVTKNVKFGERKTAEVDIYRMFYVSVQALQFNLVYYGKYTKYFIRIGDHCKLPSVAPVVRGGYDFWIIDDAVFVRFNKGEKVEIKYEKELELVYTTSGKFDKNRIAMIDNRPHCMIGNQVVKTAMSEMCAFAMMYSHECEFVMMYKDSIVGQLDKFFNSYIGKSRYEYKTTPADYDGVLCSKCIQPVFERAGSEGLAIRMILSGTRYKTRKELIIKNLPEMVILAQKNNIGELRYILEKGINCVDVYIMLASIMYKNESRDPLTEEESVILAHYKEGKCCGIHETIQRLIKGKAKSQLANVLHSLGKMSTQCYGLRQTSLWRLIQSLKNERIQKKLGKDKLPVVSDWDINQVSFMMFNSHALSDDILERAVGTMFRYLAEFDQSYSTKVGDIIKGRFRMNDRIDMLDFHVKLYSNIYDEMISRYRIFGITTSHAHVPKRNVESVYVSCGVRLATTMTISELPQDFERILKNVCTPIPGFNTDVYVYIAANKTHYHLKNFIISYMKKNEDINHTTKIKCKEDEFVIKMGTFIARGILPPCEPEKAILLVANCLWEMAMIDKCMIEGEGFACGNSMESNYKLWQRLCASYAHPVCVSIDGSAFDAKQHKCIKDLQMKIVENILQEYMPEFYDKYTKQIRDAFDNHNKGKFVSTGNETNMPDVEMKCKGTSMSGNPIKTTTSNTTAAIAYAKYIGYKAGVRVSVLAAGDDTMVICERKDLAKFLHHIGDVYSPMGLAQEAKEIVINGVTFNAKHFIRIEYDANYDTFDEVRSTVRQIKRLTQNIPKIATGVFCSCRFNMFGITKDFSNMFFKNMTHSVINIEEIKNARGSSYLAWHMCELMANAMTNMYNIQQFQLSKYEQDLFYNQFTDNHWIKANELQFTDVEILIMYCMSFMNIDQEVITIANIPEYMHEYLLDNIYRPECGMADIFVNMLDKHNIVINCDLPDETKNHVWRDGSIVPAENFTLRKVQRLKNEGQKRLNGIVSDKFDKYYTTIEVTPNAVFGRKSVTTKKYKWGLSFFETQREELKKVFEELGREVSGKSQGNIHHRKMKHYTHWIKNPKDAFNFSKVCVDLVEETYTPLADSVNKYHHKWTFDNSETYRQRQRNGDNLRKLLIST